MIEVRIPIPLDEYIQVKDDLEASFNEHQLIVLLSADTVIRTWAGLMFHDWFDKQDQVVDNFIGWGEIGVEWQRDPIDAAVAADFMDEGHEPRVVMMFDDNEEGVTYLEEEDAKLNRNLALMFKLAHGGA